MKLLVLLAVLGAASAQYKLYTGVSPYLHHAGYSAPLAYAASPLVYRTSPVAYHASPVTYSAFPYQYTGLPYAFQPAEKAAEAEKPVEVESRSKRSADEDQQADDALLYTTYAGHPYNYSPLTYSYPAGYSVPTVYNAGVSTYNTLPLAYHGYNYHGYSPVVHSLKKRDTADQQAEDATLYTTYAAHPYYSAGYPFVRSFAAKTVYNTPASTAPLTYAAPLAYNYPFNYPYVY